MPMTLRERGKKTAETATGKTKVAVEASGGAEEECKVALLARRLLKELECLEEKAAGKEELGSGGTEELGRDVVPLVGCDDKRVLCHGVVLCSASTKLQAFFFFFFFSVFFIYN